MTTEHTPGPWQLADNDETIVVTEALDAEGNCEIIADVLTAPGKARPCDFANARLIAAAPDLLEIVRDLVSDCEGTVNPGFYRLAVNALAKAEGRALPLNAEGGDK